MADRHGARRRTNENANESRRIVALVQALEARVLVLEEANVEVQREIATIKARLDALEGA